jgi:hypothetical protein
MTDRPWERARLIPVSGISGPDEQERRGASALLAVVNSVREFGRAITAPLGAPAGTPMAFIEVPFTSGERKLRPDGVLQVKRGPVLWTALIEVKTGTNELKSAQVEAYLDLAREQGFNAVLTISNQLARAPGEHPLTVDKRKLKKVSLHHLSWSQIRTEALVEQANKAVSDPDQAWILAEFIRYLEHPRSGAVEFEDMGGSWVAVREAARAATLQPADKGAAAVVRRFEQLMSFAAMLLSRELGVEVRPALSRAEVKEPDRRMQAAATALADTGILSGARRVPNARRPDRGHRRPARQPDPLLHDRRRADHRKADNAGQLADAPAARQQRPGLHRDHRRTPARQSSPSWAKLVRTRSAVDAVEGFAEVAGQGGRRR